MSRVTVDALLRALAGENHAVSETISAWSEVLREAGTPAALPVRLRARLQTIPTRHPRAGLSHLARLVLDSWSRTAAPARSMAAGRMLRFEGPAGGIDVGLEHLGGGLRIEVAVELLGGAEATTVMAREVSSRTEITRMALDEDGSAVLGDVPGGAALELVVLWEDAVVLRTGELPR